jgi:hypothetical protein
MPIPVRQNSISVTSNGVLEWNLGGNSWFSQMPRMLGLALAFTCMTSGCAPSVYGRVVSDVRVGNGFISVDRCVLKQHSFHRISVSDCETENYYIGKAVIPVQSTTSPLP